MVNAGTMSESNSKIILDTINLSETSSKDSLICMILKSGNILLNMLDTGTISSLDAIIIQNAINHRYMVENSKMYTDNSTMTDNLIKSHSETSTPDNTNFAC